MESRGGDRARSVLLSLCPFAFSFWHRPGLTALRVAEQKPSSPGEAGSQTLLSKRSAAPLLGPLSLQVLIVRTSGEAGLVCWRNLEC